MENILYILNFEKQIKQGLFIAVHLNKVVYNKTKKKYESQTDFSVGAKLLPPTMGSFKWIILARTTTKHLMQKYMVSAESVPLPELWLADITLVKPILEIKFISPSVKLVYRYLRKCFHNNNK